ncbi:ABC transporter substrate-binding protein [Chloroflexus aggregans]|uniref:Thiamine pyrimidine synthase n=1 Tax=Chloroflexus aggregans (strain MD-66 / DSM 9485) TaxID=326427 RepID=B8GBL9_CHLAD|nr:ABC transporter substrate-binding protein [Chloroflexus aggregans]ACL24836.1 NMT1/THI5 like domain protein [Chloroflexus aggregans DSM 9485]
MSTPITLALDWTPNTNHIGFYVAIAKGWYRDAGIEPIMLSPEEDNYQTTPAAKVVAGRALLAIAPSESALSYHLHPTKPSLVAIAALAQRDTSAIVTLANSGIDRPAKLDGRRYASYNARFERAIVAQMIRNDGGKGEFDEIFPPKLGIWETLLTSVADATWVFMPWEGVQARRAGIALNAFHLDDYGIPYGYTPILLAHPDALRTHPDALRALLNATAEGYRFAVHHPDEAVAALITEAKHPSLQDRDFVTESLYELAPALLTADGRWGVMDGQRWQAFVTWLDQQGLIVDRNGQRIPLAPDTYLALFTNELWN